MECYEKELIDLTDSRYWKPIVEEAEKILEQREIMKSSILGSLNKKEDVKNVK